MPMPSWTASFTTPIGSNSPAKACAGPEESRTKRLDQTSLQVTKIYRPARLATRAASFRYGGRHHSGIPGAIIPLYPGAFVVIRRIFISDPATGRFIEINQPGCRMFEKSQKSSLVGKPGLVAYDFEQIVHQGRPETPPNQGRQCSTFESLLARPMTAGQ